MAEELHSFFTTADEQNTCLLCKKLDPTFGLECTNCTVAICITCQLDRFKVKNHTCAYCTTEKNNEWKNYDIDLGLYGLYRDDTAYITSFKKYQRYGDGVFEEARSRDRKYNICEGDEECVDGCECETNDYFLDGACNKLADLIPGWEFGNCEEPYYDAHGAVIHTYAGETYTPEPRFINYVQVAKTIGITASILKETRGWTGYTKKELTVFFEKVGLSYNMLVKKEVEAKRLIVLLKL